MLEVINALFCEKPWESAKTGFIHPFGTWLSSTRAQPPRGKLCPYKNRVTPIVWTSVFLVGEQHDLNLDDRRRTNVPLKNQL
eukprot:1177335-Prorocentrum_minimum.AAC.2